MKDERSYHFLLVDKEGNILKKKILNRRDEKTAESKKFLGGMSRPEGFYFFFKDTENEYVNDYSSYFLSKENEEDVHYKLPPLTVGENESIINTFSVNNTFYFIAIDKKLNKVSFLSFFDERQFEKHSFTLEKELLKIFLKEDFRVVKNPQSSLLVTLKAFNKLYVEEKQFYFVIDNNIQNRDFGNGKIFHFNLNNNTFNYHYLPGTGVGDVSNSCFTDERIVRFVRGADKIKFYFYDLKSQKIYKKLEYVAGDEIAIVPDFVVNQKQLIEYKGNVGSPERNTAEIVEKKRHIFQSLSKGKPFIHVEKQPNGTNCLLVGSYKEVKKGYNYHLPTATGTGTPYSPQIQPGVPVGSTEGTYMNANWFNALIDESFYNIIQTPAPIPNTIKVEEFIQRLKSSEAEERDIVLIRDGNKLFAAYRQYDNRIKITEMDSY